MSWIKDNKFVVALAGGTLVGVILILLAGLNWSGQYEQAKTVFDEASAEVRNFESLPLYPRPENRDGKDKALVEYRAAAESLQTAVDGFRPKDLKNVSPEDFTNQLKAVNEVVRKAFTDAETKVPDSFFCGFENYKTSLARGSATGILQYQLTGIKCLMLALAKSGATEFKNLCRTKLPEEEGGDYKPQESAVFRPLPLEITFSGSEKAVREFVSAVIKQQDQYVVIRSLSIANSKKEPPRATDAKFDKPAAPTPAAGNDVFGGGFVLPGEEPKPDDKKPAPGGTAPAPGAAPTPAPGTAPAPGIAPAPAPAPAPVDSSRILSQVLGNEDVQVFLRLDLLQFLPVKKLP